jgi:hypothetical protein
VVDASLLSEDFRLRQSRSFYRSMGMAVAMTGNANEGIAFCQGFKKGDYPSSAFQRGSLCPLDSGKDFEQSVSADF